MNGESSFVQLSETLREKGVKLLAVSKTQPPERILELYQCGQRRFGENRVQEMLPKAEALPGDIEWHLIGHLQTNKVRFIAPFVHTIQSVDTLKLLQEIEKQGARCNRSICCLLQFFIAEEETKFGFSLPEAESLFDNHPPTDFPHIIFGGVMGMATFTDDTSKVRAEFQTLRRIFVALKNRYFPNDERFCDISMGMSGDWPIAVEEGSTLVRLGTLLFGDRNQPV